MAVGGNIENFQRLRKKRGSFGDGDEEREEKSIMREKEQRERTERESEKQKEQSLYLQTKKMELFLAQRKVLLRQEKKKKYKEYLK